MGVGEVGGQDGAVKWKVQCVRFFDFAPVCATIVDDGVERVTMMQIKQRKSKPGGSAI